MAEQRKKVSLPVLFDKMAKGTPLTMITCYDYPMAYLVEQAGIDIVLVGDSLGMTILGFDSTLPVTMDDMIRHAQAVRRGTPNGWLIGDMPYMSYQASDESAVLNAGRFMAEAACDGIKLEGGIEVCSRVRAIVAAGIPVMGHLGLTPQSVSSLGGFRLQGKSAKQAKKIVDDAKALEDAGAMAILLELVPDQVCELITERVEGADHQPGQRPERARPAPDLPRHVRPLPALHAEDGEEVRRRRQGHRRRPEAVRRRGDQQGLPRAGALLRHQGRGVRRAASG